MPADQPSENPAMRRRDWLVALLVLTVAAVLIALSLRGGSKDPPGEQQPAANGSPADGPVATVIEPEQEPLLDLARRQADDPMSAGPADAPVSLVVYSD